MENIEQKMYPGKKQLRLLSVFFYHLFNPEGMDRLYARVMEIDSWAEKHNVEVTQVSGMPMIRTNPQNGEREVLLVTGKHSDPNDEWYGKEKGFWQFPGGRVKEGQDPFDALQEEIQDELGFTPEAKDVEYKSTFVQKPNYEAARDEQSRFEKQEVYAVHAFVVKEGSSLFEKPLKLGSDVSRAEWLSNPFVDENGDPRVLTPQTRHMLIGLGFKPPFPLDEDEYDGDEKKIKFSE